MYGNNRGRSNAEILAIFSEVWVRDVDSWHWATADQEAQDEKNDVEILKAVFTSMEDYWMRKLTNSHRKKRADSGVCYGEIGCFEDTGPFGYIDMLPSSPEEISTRFLLYSRRSRGDVPLLDIPFSNMSHVWSWAAKAFNSSVPTKIIVHGFGSSCSHVWVYEMRSALMSVEDCNVICVDWESGAIIPNYVRAAANTRLVGKQLAMLIRGLTEHVGLPLEKVHLIGFSLGAHVAGFAGAELKNISRITGLDPAGPLFESQDPRARLDSSDAMFVDVIHSNGENLILGGLGSWQPMGHVDFYPNGGRMQKGCTNLFVGAVSDIIWSASDIEGRSLCNHRRAYKFFTDSVSPRCHFPAFPCESYDKFLEGKCFPCSTKYQCGNMGYYADKSSARGTLYLITREEEPFCAHQYHVSVESSPSKLPVVSYGKIQITLLGDNSINETFTLTKKDDEELGVGTTLSKIVVPHPVLQEPNAIEIIYTAYSGWISSGLKKWSIDRIKISDSFGKSLSICKKDLILESNVPVTLKLYPGECNLPKEKPESTTTEEIDPFFITESNKPSENVTALKNQTTPNLTGNKTVDGFPAYDINKEYYNLLYDKNETDIGVTIDAIVPKISIQSAFNASKPEKNYTLKIIRRNEITEPILQPKSISRDFKEEIDEPVLKAIEKVEVLEKKMENPEDDKRSAVRPRGIDLGNFNMENRIDGNYTTSKQWVPSVELFPPPLGGKQSWETTREPKTVNYRNSLKSMVPPPLQKSQRTDLPSFVMTLQNKMLHFGSNKTNGKLNGSRSLNTSQQLYAPNSNLYGNFPKNEDGSITVQLFPQHLASILKQAEQYAKMSLFSPLDIFSKSKSKRNRTSTNEKRSSKNETKLEEKKDEGRKISEPVATPRNIDSKPKNFLPRIYEYFEKGLENVRSLFGINQDSGGKESKENITLVPYYYVNEDSKSKKTNESKEIIFSGPKEKYIPLGRV